MGQRFSNCRISKRMPKAVQRRYTVATLSEPGQSSEAALRSSTFDVPPDDESKVRSLETHHTLIRDFWEGSNFSSPIHEQLTNGRCRVLDCGCGSGGWILDMAKTYPLSTFLGIDSLPVFPKEIELGNTAFINHDVLHGLPFPQATFDFVYQRFLWAAFTQKQWIQVVDELTRVLKIGGYMEFMEYDIQVHNPGVVGKRLSYAAQSYMVSKLMDPGIAHSIRQMMQNTRQFVDVKVEVKHVPIGWDGRRGEMGLSVAMNGFSSMQAALSNVIGVDSGRYNALLETFSNEGKRSRMYLKVLRVYGRKVNQHAPGSTLSRAELKKTKEKAWSF